MVNHSWCRSLLCMFLAVLVCSSMTIASTVEEVAASLTGKWAMVQFLVAAADLPIVGTLYIDTIVGVLTEVTQTGSALVMQDAYCFTDTYPSTILFRTDIPDVVLQSIQPDPRTVALHDNGAGWEIIQDWHTEVRGAVFEFPETDELPTSADDPRLVDIDGDGNPGMTILAEVLGLFQGEAYAVQRYRYSLQGTLVDEDTIIGQLQWTSEQTIVAGTHDILLLPFEDYTDPDSSKHRFIMKRVDDSWDSELLRERLPEFLAELGIERELDSQSEE